MIHDQLKFNLSEDIYNKTGTFKELKDKFLLNYKSPGKLDYKRYVKSPLRYAGGKSLAVGKIIELLPDDVDSVVSPFVGGASIEIAISSELNCEVLAFDIFDILANYWKWQGKDPEGLYENLKKFEPTRDEFKRVKNILKLHWDNEKKLNFDSYLASLYFFNSNTSYGPHFLGWPSDIYLNEERYKKTLEKVKNFRSPKLKVANKSFEKVIPNYPNNFLYCDPPYYLDEGKTFVGMYPHRNFPIHHKGFKHKLLRDLLKKHNGKWILSYNDCPTIREWYKEYDIQAPKWQYTFGQGDTRIGKNRMDQNEGSHIKKSHELIIKNF